MGMAQSSSSSSRPSDSEQLEEPSKPVMALDKAKEIVASSPVVVFSKTYCPFCARVKRLLAELAASYKAVELDVESEWIIFFPVIFFLLVILLYILTYIC